MIPLSLEIRLKLVDTRPARVNSALVWDKYEYFEISEGFKIQCYKHHLWRRLKNNLSLKVMTPTCL